MERTIYYCGIDVDDKNFNVALRNSKTEEMVTFKCAPMAKTLKNKLTVMGLDKEDLRFCYEASYSGFVLYRELNKIGLNCEVIAPSLIPQKPGEKVKTDRLDSQKLAEYYGKKELTIIMVPNENDEIIRDILRARKLILEQLKGVRRHLLAICRRAGLYYRESTKSPKASHWTQMHYKWIIKQLKQLTNKNLQFNISSILSTSNLLEQQILQYDQYIEQLSLQQKYKNKVQALRCFKGLDTLSSMTLVTELGDIKRFAHPTKLPSYAGMDIIEYSSGGREKRFGITKQGNRHIRTTVIEACQFAFAPITISKNLQKRREGVDPKYISIADRCMHRLKKKSNRLLFKGKPKNKVKVACARELLCFVWEALQAAS